MRHSLLKLFPSPFPNLAIEPGFLGVTRIAQSPEIVLRVVAAVHQRSSVVNFELVRGSTNQAAPAVTLFDFALSFL